MRVRHVHQREAAQGLSRWLEALVVLVGMISDVVTGILLGRQRLGRAGTRGTHLKT